MSAATEPHVGGNMAIPTAIAGLSGGFIDLENPTPEMIHLEDVARGCSMQVRYSGQLTAFYSVAEHSVLVYDLFRLANPDAPAGEWRYAFLHDGHEAYIGDVTSPLKRAMYHAVGLGRPSGFAIIEARFEAVIRERFSLPPLTDDLKARVKRADLQARFLEGVRLQPKELVWQEGAGDLPRGISCAFGLDWRVAEAMFLQVAAQLGVE